MKELNIMEAMKMSIGTEFEVFSTINRKFDVNMILRENDNNKKYLGWADNEPLKVFEFLMETKFIPIQQSVSFTDVLNSDNQCKVIHKNITESFSKRFVNEYMGFSYLMEQLSGYFTSDELRDVIKNGKWYLEKEDDN